MLIFFFQDRITKSSIISGFKRWVQICQNNHYGCIFADNMIVPIPIQAHKNSC